MRQFRMLKTGHAERALHTQLAVDTDRVFLGYHHASTEASEVTFNLKDFKTMLARSQPKSPDACSAALVICWKWLCLSSWLPSRAL